MKIFGFKNSVIFAALMAMQLAATAASAAPLTKSANQRYFTDGSGKAIYMSGSHTWNNFQDLDGILPYSSYLDMLSRNNHNFVRLWTIESPYLSTGARIPQSQMPYMRTTGIEKAYDGGKRYDLALFNPDYFNRMRARVIDAKNRGMYVAIILFNFYGPDNATGWLYHPLRGGNNVIGTNRTGINGDLNGDGVGREVHTLLNPQLVNIQKAYVRKVIDTVNDLDNVLYDVCNECHSDSISWQYDMINYIKSYESGKPKKHPVGMTSQGQTMPDDTAALFASPADWISPNAMTYDYKANPPAATGSKVIISDTDHYFGVGGTQSWAWKSFTRGINPIYMDPMTDFGAQRSYKTSTWNIHPTDSTARLAMGQTRRYADKMNLVAMAPRGDLCSSGYCLANPGVEYIAYLPAGGSVTISGLISANSYAVEWVNTSTGAVTVGTTSPSGGATSRSFSSPFGSASAALYLKSTGGGAITPKPDLVVTSFNYANGVFSATVKNIGTAATPTNLSPGILYYVNDTWKTWGYITQPIAAGASVNIGTQGGSYVIPNGTHVIKAFVDNINQFAELNEGNNTLSQTIQVGTPKPDLVVTALNYAGGVFTATVKNQGTAATPTGLSPGILYYVNDTWKTWGYITQPIAVGASVNIGTQGGNYVIPMELIISRHSLIILTSLLN